VDLRHCLAVANRPSPATLVIQGGGLYAESGATRLMHCTFATNLWEGARHAGGTLSITNSILWANGDDLVGVTENVGYTCIEDGDFSGVNGCISADPLFVDTTYYHLRSRNGHYAGGYFDGGAWERSSASSPCIDAGDPTSAYLREPQPNGRRANMGCYGNTPVASLNPAPLGLLLSIR
jgi:hypothetical protein